MISALMPTALRYLNTPLWSTGPYLKLPVTLHSWLDLSNFSSSYIPCFEQRIAPLRDLIEFDMNHNIVSALTPAHHTAKQDMIDTIYSDPCIARFKYIQKNLPPH